MQRYPGVMAPEDQARQQALYDVIAFGPARRGEGRRNWRRCWPIFAPERPMPMKWRACSRWPTASRPR
ncbi:hypothetical protein P0F65_09640 [Sphingomonas sp. I4]